MTVANLVAALPTRRLDGVWLALALAFALLALMNPPQGAASAVFVADAALYIAPFLLLSIGIAAWAKASRADHLIARAFQGRIATMTVAAAVMGAFSPFCSCGVIPLIAALLGMGVPLAPVMAFWLASPIMDPSMFVLTAGTLGTEFAVAKTAAALGLGLLGGFGTWALTSRGLFQDAVRPEIGKGGCGGAAVRSPKPIVWRFWNEDGRSAAFAQDARNNLLFLGKWLLLAFFLESLMVAWLPADLVVNAVGGNGWLPVMLATVVGVPAYLNGYAALPLVAQLIEQGMSPGAGMAFLVAGGVTSIPAAIAVWALVRWPVFLAYLAFALTGAFIAGALYGLIT